MSSINPDYNNYVRNPDFKGENKQMPKMDSLEEANVFYEVDEDGNEVRRFVDYDKDGNADVIATIDSNGQISEEIIDQDGDGKADIHVTYEYDEDGNEVARHVDYDMDGISDVDAQIVNNAVIYSENIDQNDDGTVDLHVDYTYDEEGNEHREIDYNLDGKTDVLAHVNADGEITAEEVDTNGDGIVDTHVEYSKDEEGNEIVTSQRDMREIDSTLPQGWVVEGGRILNEEGEEVGLVVNTQQGQVYFEFTD